MGTIGLKNDHFAAIMGYGDYQIRNVTISRVYYIKGLGHNLFSVGQFCDFNLEVAFQKHSCFVCDLEGVDLLKGTRGTNLYAISLEDMLKSSSICLLSKASKIKSWLWHQRLSHLNFCTVNQLAKEGLVREFVNQTLKSYYEDVVITHQNSVVRTSQQNDVVERQNQTLVEAARTMLIFSKAPLFLWSEVVATPYLKYLYLFGALCYPINDSEAIGKLKPKGDIGIFIRYSLVKKAYRIYNKQTRLIMEIIHVEFDELTIMASEQFSLGLYFKPSPSVVSPEPPTTVPISDDTTGTPSSTIIDQDAPFIDNDPFINIFIPELSSKESSSRDVIPSNLHQVNQPFDYLKKWTKDHPLDNVIGNPSRHVSTRCQL
ncbi:integrase, catalytic region, zinc finger, CCHC-type containing protein [Tanacetum coccineum]